MFDFFKNSILVKIFLAVISLSFVYFGIGSLRTPQVEYISQIGDTKITNFDVKNYLQRNRQINIIQAYIFLQKRAYLIEGGKKAGIEISADQINQIIKSEPSFKDLNGNFDALKYRQFINNVYRFDALFEEELRNNATMTYVSYYLLNNHIISDYQLLQYLAIYDTQKEIQNISFPIANYKNQVKYTDEDLQAFYREHQKAYQQAESIRFEYLHVTPEWKIKQVAVTEDEIKNYYENNRESHPKRMVSHIVFIFPPGEKLDEVAKSNLKKQAELVLQKVKQQPEKFSELAAKYSQDASTAQFGGSLGLIEKNTQYYESIENAAFSLSTTGKVYDELVETDDGYHIIKVDAALDWQSYTQDKVGIDYVLRFNKAKESLIAINDELSEASFNESKDLRKISQQVLGQDIVQSNEGWMSKPEALLTGFPVEVIQALFQPSSIADKTNSDVINVGGSYWIVRVTDSREARLLPFEEVRSKVVEDYVLMRAGELALEDANNVFGQLSKGQDPVLDWGGKSILSVEQAKSDFSQEEYIKFLSTSPKQNRPGYYLLDKRSPPIIVRVNSEHVDYPFKEEKLKLSFDKAKNILSKKNEIAALSYLYNKVKRKKGRENLDI